MSADVRVKVSADGAGFERTFNSLEKRVHGLSHNVSHGLKEAFVGFVGAASIGLLVENMVSYAETITRASERMGVATDRIQELRKVANDAGKDLSAFDAVFRNIDKNASKALVVGSKEGKSAHALGLSDDDLKHLNKDEILKKALKGTEGMGRTQAESLIGNLVGSKNAGWIVGNKERILSGEGFKVGNEDMAALVEFKNQLEDLTDVVRVALIPALTGLIKWATSVVAGYTQGERTLGEKEKMADELYFNKHGSYPSAGLKVSNDISFSALNTGNLLNPAKSAEEKKARTAELQDTLISSLYGDDILAELNKTYVPTAESTPLDNLEAERKKRAEERAKQQAEMAGPVDRDAPVTKDAKTKEIKMGELSGANSFLKIGGLMGIDAQYRMERIGQRTNELLQQIAKNTEPAEPDNAPDPEDPFE